MSEGARGFGGIAPFALERFFARWEFAVRYNLCASDIEGMPMRELLALADDETRALWDSLRLGYTEANGHPLLRAEIASLYERATEDDVLCFAGAEEAIFLAMHAMLEPGDHVVCVWPAYQSLFEVARSAGAEVALVPLAPDDWGLDVARVREVLTPRTKAVVVNFPHSPTGALPSRETFAQLVALCEERGVRLVCDEVYRFSELDPADRLPAGVDSGEQALSIGVMSKSFALAGLRIGWIATRDRALLARMAALKDYTTICNAGPSEILSLVALRAREAVLERSRAILARNLPLLDQFFGTHADSLEWVRPRGATVGFPRFRTGSADELAERAVRDAGVLILPGSLFGYDARHFRIGFGRADLPEALAAFESILHPRR